MPTGYTRPVPAVVVKKEGAAAPPAAPAPAPAARRAEARGGAAPPGGRSRSHASSEVAVVAVVPPQQPQPPPPPVGLPPNHNHGPRDNVDLMIARERMGQCGGCSMQTYQVILDQYGREVGRNPLTIAGEVHRGRCLLCNPLPAQRAQRAQQRSLMVSQSSSQVSVAGVNAAAAAEKAAGKAVAAAEAALAACPIAAANTAVAATAAGSVAAGRVNAECGNANVADAKPTASATQQQKRIAVPTASTTRGERASAEPESNASQFHQAASAVGSAAATAAPSQQQQEKQGESAVVPAVTTAAVAWGGGAAIASADKPQQAPLPPPKQPAVGTSSPIDNVKPVANAHAATAQLQKQTVAIQQGIHQLPKVASHSSADRESTACTNGKRDPADVATKLKPAIGKDAANADVRNKTRNEFKVTPITPVLSPANVDDSRLPLSKGGTLPTTQNAKNSSIKRPIAGDATAQQGQDAQPTDIPSPVADEAVTPGVAEDGLLDLLHGKTQQSKPAASVATTSAVSKASAVAALKSTRLESSRELNDRGSSIGATLASAAKPIASARKSALSKAADAPPKPRGRPPNKKKKKVGKKVDQVEYPDGTAFHAAAAASASASKRKRQRPLKYPEADKLEATAATSTLVAATASEAKEVHGDAKGAATPSKRTCKRGGSSDAKVRATDDITTASAATEESVEDQPEATATVATVAAAASEESVDNNGATSSRWSVRGGEKSNDKTQSDKKEEEGAATAGRKRGSERTNNAKAETSVEDKVVEKDKTPSTRRHSPRTKPTDEANAEAVVEKEAKPPAKRRKKKKSKPRSSTMSIEDEIKEAIRAASIGDKRNEYKAQMAYLTYMFKTCTSDEQAAMIVKNGGVEVILRAMQAFPTSVYIQFAACKLLVNIIYYDPKAYTPTRKIYPDVLKAMRAHNIVDLHHHAIGTLQQLALLPCLKHEIIESGCLTQVVSVMQTYPFRSNVQENACLFLQDLVRNVPSYDDVESVLKSGALDCVLAALKKYHKSTSFLEAALGAIANIFFDEHVPDELKSKVMLEDGLVQILAGSMSSSSSHVVFLTCNVLLNVCMEDFGVNQGIVNAGLIPKTAKAMRRFQRNERIQTVACIFLGNLSFGNIHERGTKVAEGGGSAAIIDCLKPFGNKAGVMREVMSALRNVGHPEERSAFHTASLILVAMQKHKNDSKVQEHGCVLLHQYIDDLDVNLLLKKGDGQDALSHAAERFPDMCKETVDDINKELLSMPDPEGMMVS